MAVWLVVCRSKLHQRIHAINPGWLEEWITDWPGEEILVRLGLRLWAENHLEVEDLKVQITVHRPRRQGDDDDVGNQLPGWEQRLGLVGKSIENVWIRFREELFWTHYMSWQNHWQ